MSIVPYKGMLYVEPYMHQSTEIIQKRELMNLCIDRIKAYQKVNQLYAQLDDIDQQNTKPMRIYNQYNCFLGSKDEFWIKDNAAHFFLEIVYSESEDKILEFLKFQIQLFQTRYSYILLNDENNEKLIKMFKHLIGDQSIQQLTKKEWEDLSNHIKNGTGKPLQKLFTQQQAYSQFYKVPYQNVLHSVSQLHTYIHKGIAYIQVDELKKCIQDVFITRMKRRMQNYQNKQQYEKLKNIDEYKQMFQKILQTDSGELNQKFIGLQQDTLNCMTVKQQSLDLFPLCMEYLIDRLETNHHLKHSGRQQIQLFFKSAGMKMNETIKYLKIQFSPKINESDFDKNYAYNIRHNYGQEGKRENYQCYSCSYNLKQAPGNDEYHGCPIKTLNNEALERYLKNKKKYETTDIEQILNLKKGNHFQLACTQIWQIKCKGNENNIIIDNPIVFYREALEHHKKITLKVEQEK